MGWSSKYTHPPPPHPRHIIVGVSQKKPKHLKVKLLTNILKISILQNTFLFMQLGEKQVQFFLPSVLLFPTTCPRTSTFFRNLSEGSGVIKT